MKKLALIALVALLAIPAVGSDALAAGHKLSKAEKKGKRVANKCKACHDLTSAKKNKVGPYLWGIMDAKGGAVEGYKFSDEHMAKAPSLTWDDATMAEYLTNPKAMIPGNKMSFAGLKKEKDRKNLIAFLRTLKD